VRIRAKGTLHLVEVSEKRRGNYAFRREYV